MLESVEFVVESLHISDTESRVRISRGTFTITLEAVNASSTSNGRTYRYQDNGKNRRNSSSVFLPQELLDVTKTDDSLSTAVFTVYRSPGLFIKRQSSHLMLNSDIFSASISQKDVEGLSDPVVITINIRVRIRVY